MGQNKKVSASSLYEVNDIPTVDILLNEKTVLCTCRGVTEEVVMAKVNVILDLQSENVQLRERIAELERLLWNRINKK